MNYGATIRPYIFSRHTITCTIILFLITSSMVIINAYAVSGPGPSNPGSDNTMIQYCSTGTCIVNGTGSFLNSTRGFFAYGNYTNGIHLNTSTLYGIQLSDSCIRMEIHHIASNCLKYNQIQFLDNTNPNYAGKWVNDTWYHRLLPSTKQSWNFQTNKTVIMVDPDQDFTTRAKMIIVTNSEFTFINPDEKISNHIRTEFHDRWVSSDCSNAIISPNIWLVNDTLHYLESGCKITRYNGTSFNTTPYHSLNYDTWNVKTVNWLSHFNNVTRTGNCIWEKCDIQTDIYHNHGFGW